MIKIISKKNLIQNIKKEKQIMKKTVSTILIIAILLLSTSMFSCGFTKDVYHNNHVPDWYVGGYGSKYRPDIYFWVETYDEMKEAVQLLESNGSTFENKVILDYEGDLFDVKYCFVMHTSKTKRVPWGENQFDRKAEDVTLGSVIFFEDVTIEWIENHRIQEDQCYYVKANFSADDFADLEDKNLPREWFVEEMKVNMTIDKTNATLTYDLRYRKECIVTVDENKYLTIYQNFSLVEDTLTDECIDAILDSMVELEIN